MPADSESELLAEVKGKPVNVAFGGNFLAPSAWGLTRLRLYSTRVTEKTKFVVAERDSELLLSEVTGAAFVTQGNPLFLVLGIPLVIVLIGIVFLILYAMFKRRFLIIHGKTFTLHVTVAGNPDKYRDFMEAVLEQAELVRKKLSASPASSTGSSASFAPAASRQASDTATVNCPECNAHYRVPASAAGKKIRCSKCGATIQT